MGPLGQQRSVSFAYRHPLFEQSHQLGKDETQNKIDHGQDRKEFEGPESGCRNDLGPVGEVRYPQNGDKGRKLEKADEVVRKGGEHLSDGLGKDDVNHRVSL